MVEKKTTKTTAKKAPAAKKTTVRKTAAKKVEVVVDATNAGYKAGDVYQTLSAAEKALTVKEIAAAAKISVEDAYLGIGWLFKEGKIKGEDGKVTLA